MFIFNERQKMQMKRILVPIDFSEAGKESLRYAIPIAKQSKASIFLIHVVPSLTGGRFLPDLQISKAAREQIEKFATRKIPLEITREIRVLQGSPSQELVNFARKLKIDLMVTTTHGYTGWKHALLGSTAERIIQHSPCPVLVIRNSKGVERHSVEPQKLFSRILVGTDFSTYSDKAMRYALSMAEDYRSKVSIIHVVEPPMYPSEGFPSLAAQEKKMVLSAAEEIEHWRLKWNDQKSLIKTIKLRSGDALPEILREAKKQKSNLLLVSTHGHTGWKRVFLGSTCEKLIRYAKCPVMVVRAHGREFDKIYNVTYPVAQYDHDEGLAITGGFEYWGEAIPEMKGKFFFGDINNGRLFYVELADVKIGSQATIKEWKITMNGKPTSMPKLCGNARPDMRYGRDAKGELYLFGKTDGKVYRLVPSKGI